MFTNNMNLNTNKVPVLVPTNATSNITSSSQHGSNQSLNIPEQQQSINSPRSPLATNANNNDPSLLMCGPNTTSYPPLYTNNANPGKESSIIRNFPNRFSI